MLTLDDHWVWDFWFARHEERHHVFFLKAPRALGDPDLRHWNASIGHAVSDDLRRWEVLPDAIGPGPAPSWDDRATWTGCVMEHDGTWYLFHSGVSAEHDGIVQRIGVATSTDLLTWRKQPGPIIEPDPRWYEVLDREVWFEETWRDPWVFPEPDGGGWRMYFTARANHGIPDERGVIGQARSDDLVHWEVLPPLTDPGDFGHLEVPQVVTIGDWHYLVFSVYEWAHAATRLQRAEAVCGTHYLMGRSPLGPFTSPGDEFLHGSPAGPFYAGRLVEHDGAWLFASWAQFAPDGSFVGALADPVPVVQHDDGTLSLAEPPSLPDAPNRQEAHP
jgi:beta-fructofuranosidase